MLKKGKTIRIDAVVVDAFDEWVNRRRTVGGDVVGAVLVLAMRLDPVDRERLVDDYNSFIAGELSLDEPVSIKTLTDQEELFLAGFRRMDQDSRDEVMLEIIRNLAERRHASASEPTEADLEADRRGRQAVKARSGKSRRGTKAG